MAVFYKATDNNYIRLKIEVNERSVDVGRNVSIVDWHVAVENSASYGFNNSGNSQLQVWIDNALVHDGYYSYDSRQGTVLFRGTNEVPHNPDGTKNMRISANFNTQTYGMIVDCNGTIALTRIGRASELTLRNQSGVEISEIILGEKLRLWAPRSDGSFRLNFYYNIGNGDVGIVGDVNAEGYNWDVPLNWAEQITDSTTRTVAFRVATIHNGNLLGWSSKTIRVHVPNSMVPTISAVRVSETNNAVKAVTSQPVQILSKLKVDVTASGASGSTITSYRVDVLNRNISVNGNGTILPVLNFNGQTTIRSTVTDSRGRTASKDVSINILEYHAPAIKIEATRTGTDSQTITVKQVVDVSPIGNRNWFTLIYYIGGQANQRYTNQKLYNLNGNLDMTGRWDGNQSYEVKAVITDKFTTTTVNTLVGRERVVMGYAPEGISVGKPHEIGTLDIADDNIYIAGVKLIDFMYPIGTELRFRNNNDYSNHMGGRWERVGGGRTSFGYDPNQPLFNTVGKQGGSLTHSHNAGTLEALIGSAGGRADTIAYKASNKNATQRPTYAISGGVHGIGGNNAHNTEIIGSTDTKYNLPPYDVVAIWVRVG